MKKVCLGFLYYFFILKNMFKYKLLITSVSSNQWLFIFFSLLCCFLFVFVQWNLVSKQPKHNVEYNFGIINDDVSPKIRFKNTFPMDFKWVYTSELTKQNSLYNHQVLFSVQKWSILFGKSDSLVHTFKSLPVIFATTDACLKLLWKCIQVALNIYVTGGIIMFLWHNQKLNCKVSKFKFHLQNIWDYKILI